MLLIGGYEDTETGIVYFLLQNWWKSKYFIQAKDNVCVRVGDLENTALVNNKSDKHIGMLDSSVSIVL
jgi:hypothetical protein